MKLLIADDEPLIRYSLISFLYDLGVAKEDILEASNGEQFLKLMKEFPIDAALVDIRMPLLDGLNAIRQAKDIAPHTDYYVLSGFSDFKYAQEGIRLEIKDYLLKPVKKSELQEIVNNTRQAIASRHQKELHLLTAQVAEMMSGKQTDFIFPSLCYPLFITDDTPNTAVSSWQLPSGLSDSLHLIHRTEQGTWIFIFSQEKPAACINSITAYVLKQLTGHTVLEANPLANSRDWPGEQKRRNSFSFLLPAVGISRFYPRTFQVPVLHEEVKKLCGLCQHNIRAYAAKDYTRYCLTNNGIVKALDRLFIQQSPYTKNILRFITAAYNLEANTIPELEKELDCTAKTLLQSHIPKDLVLDNVLNYIHEHYREDMGLEKVASLYNLTPNYFSTLFRKKTGQNFVQYLIFLRISESKRLLLESDLTIREVGCQVGYYSCSYFIKRFAALEGITPAEYRAKRRS
ncbi:response regulator transcription factor [Lacrimispora brassicae]